MQGFSISFKVASSVSHVCERIAYGGTSASLNSLISKIPVAGYFVVSKRMTMSGTVSISGI
jgi:hypothetical protein